jgi:beta-lactamase class A
MGATETSSMRARLPQGWTTADKTGSSDDGSTTEVALHTIPQVGVSCSRA